MPLLFVRVQVVSFTIQLLGDLICIGMLNQFWISLGFLFFLFPVVSFSYVNIDCSSHPCQKCNHGKFMGQVLRNHSEELVKKCMLYPLMLCLKIIEISWAIAVSPQFKEMNAEVLMFLTKGLW